MFGPRVGFLKFSAEAYLDNNPYKIPGIVFARGGAVAILIELHCEGSIYALLIRQPRLPIGFAQFPEIVAGMLDGSGNFAGMAAKELEEETGITIHHSQLVDLTQLAYGDRFRGMYPSMGACDEFIRLFLYREAITRARLDELRGRLGGLRDHGEYITMEIVPFDDLWRLTSDAKTLCALQLRERLHAAGLLTLEPLVASPAQADTRTS